MKYRIIVSSLIMSAVALGVLGWMLQNHHKPTERYASDLPKPPRVVYVTNVLAAADLPPLLVSRGNLAGFIADARSRGLKDCQIRALVLADALTPVGNREFWRTQTHFGELRDEASREAAVAALDAELEAAGLPVRAVNEFVADPATRARLNGELAPLEAKRKALALKNTGGPWSQDDWEEYEKVLGEMTAVAKKILSPQELLDWEVRQQTPAVERLQRLPGFEFSGPEEFKAAYTIEREYRERSEKGEALAGLIAQRDAQLKALFGDARWKNYERSHDASFAAEVDLVSRHSLPTEYAAWLYDLREQFYDYERKLRDASGLSDDDRQGHLDEIRQKYRSFIAQYLSQPILDAYTESGGFWLRP